MAQVVKNVDDTFTATLSGKERRTLKRQSDKPPGVPSAKTLELLITETIKGWAADFRAEDGPARLAKFDLLETNKQDQIDAILNGG